MSEGRESLFAALLHPSRELARLAHDDRLLVVRQSGTGEDLRVIISNEDDVAAQSVVLTNYEVRWLVYRVFGSDEPPIPRWRFWLANARWRLRRG